MKDILLKLAKLTRKPFIWAILFYQRFLSPDHSFWAKRRFPHGYCPFFPTCSEYGRQAFTKYGVFKGGFMTMWRIMRCHPWTKGGVDEV